MTRRGALAMGAGLLAGSEAMATSEFRLREDAASAVVTLLIFSGRADPTWTLTGERLADLAARFKALPPAPAGAAPALPPLGYQGMTIRFPDGAALDVGGGRILSGGRALRADPGRAFERWLLETGAAHVEPLPLDAARKEIERAR